MLGFLKIGAVSLLAIMSLSWLVALFFNVTALGKSVSDALAGDIGTTLSAYACAVAYTLVFAAVLGKLGDLALIRKLEATALARLLSARDTPPRKLLILIALICTTESWLLLKGVISYRTFAIAGFDEGHIPWFLPMLEVMFAAQVGLNALALSQLAKARRRAAAPIFVVVASVFLILFINFTQGRSGFVFCAVLHLYWYVLFFGRAPKFRKLIVAGALVLPLLYTGTLLNNFMRSGNAGGLDLKTVGFVRFLGQALETWQSDQSLQQLEKLRSATNLASRPLVANPLAKSLALPMEQKSFLLGENLINSAIWAIPSALISDKASYPVQEDLLYAHFPIGTGDTADSPYLYAYVDFAYAGVLFYPVLLAGFWIMALLLTNLPFISSLGIIVVACSWIPLFTLSLGEMAMTGWFTMLRNTVLAIPFLIVLAKVFRFPSQRFTALT
ncbi:hypothetical protein [Hydrocarboniphaga sp.]|uniref:hypothetical protein n=1 Tax=Hydrocarboniphaga sp. TaxID=2033016 RepID=UPI003D0C60FD